MSVFVTDELLMNFLLKKLFMSSPENFEWLGMWEYTFSKIETQNKKVQNQISQRVVSFSQNLNTSP